MDVTDEHGAAPTRRPSARMSLVVGVVGIVWVLLHAVGLLDEGSTITFGLLGLTAAVATAVGVHRWKPEPRWPWITLLVAEVLALAGGGLRMMIGTLGDLTSSRSVLPDVLSLPAYLVLAVSLAGLARSALPRHEERVNAIIDAVIASLALLTLAWVYLMTPALSQAHAPLTVRLLLAAYPPASMFVAAMSVQLLFSSSKRPPVAFRLVMACMFGLLAGDVIYMLVDVGIAEIPQTLVDVPYALAYVALAAAVLHPSIRRVADPVTTGEAVPSRGRLVFVAAALCVPVVVLLFPAETLATNSERVIVGLIVLLLTVMASWRMFRALQQHARSQARLAHQATHDELTGLPNRLFLQEHLGRVLGQQRGESSPVAVLFLDIDRFKLVNDTMGHSTGDDLLVAVAERLQRNVRSTDLVGRIGGDEFAVIVHGVRDEPHAMEAAERTRLALHTPFTVRGAEIPVSASVGVALYQPEGGIAQAEAMLRDADTAMYQAKDRGGDTVVCFDGSMRERVAERLFLERELRQALARNQLSVHYQPKVRLSDQRVVGMEALLRWTHPTLGFVPPDEFIPIAEDTGMIVDLGAWVLDQACAELARVAAELARPDQMSVSVNLSVRQLRDGSMIDHVARALLRHGIAPGALCLELTESMLMADVDHLTRHLAALRNCGVRISIDDFGTGYSSLAYLRRLPIDEVKIDRSFVWDLDDEGPGASMVSAVVAIAGSLDIATCAEGVETQAQLDQLTELGCAEGQGYLFSRPVPAEQLLDVLRELGCASPPRLRAVSSA
jgi:diguanylate cyclase (GGDEF)-like protein